MESFKRDMRRGILIRISVLLLVFSGCFFSSSGRAHALTNISDTKHNLSVSGPGPIKALTESRICVFCHTPHNATPSTPLWNKDIEPQTYTFYTSPTLKSPIPVQPTGPTKLCLSCHDGTIALGSVVNPSGGIAISGGVTTIPSGSLSYIGLNLSSHHPVSFSYYSALPNTELASSPPPGLDFGGGSAEVHCTTCHDPHNDMNGKFLAMDNRYSSLCTACHQISGWNASAHATSTASVSGILPIPPKTWPTWSTVAEWGCEVCHTPHFATSPQWLLNYASTDYCLSCHSSVPSPIHSQLEMANRGEEGTGTAAFLNREESTGSMTSNAACSDLSCHASISPPVPARMMAQTVQAPVHGAPLAAGLMADIRGQMNKISNHRGNPSVSTATLHTPKESPRSMVRHVTCVDCHSPHAANKRGASAPYASGLLQGVRGIDRNGVEIPSLNYEYELCFKCHSDYNPDYQYIPRVINTTNMRLAFDPINASFHPVIAMGRNPAIPSIPSNFEPTMNASNIIYCTDCHGDDAGGSRGPHGSSFPPILKERYETTDHTPENYQNYALCYRCHNRTNILSDASFQNKIARTTSTGGGHSGHLAIGAPCSACHDPHGVNSTPGSGTGDHESLINFDVRIITPVPGNTYPFYARKGTFAGSCTLVCHGRVHINESYP